MRKVCKANERSEASVSAISTKRKTSVFAEVFSLYKRESKPHCPSFAEQKGEKLGFVSQTVGAIHESPVNSDVILRNNTEVVSYS